MISGISQQPNLSATAPQGTVAARALCWQATDQVSFRGNEKKDEKKETANKEKKPWHWGQRFKNSMKAGWQHFKSGLTDKWNWGLLGLFALLSLIPGVHLMTCSAVPFYFMINFVFGAFLNFNTDEQMAEKQGKRDEKEKDKKP